ncbi:MAG TPA: M48 family metalloprotease [candidate division Zixibacteria bacterium]|nr:M48 family metalloprotease [candidate division Zixibacteria bacterium]
MFRVRNVRLVGTLLFGAIVPAACGPALQPPKVSPQLLERESALQRELLFKTLIERKVQLQRLYTPLRIANADLCGADVSPVTGITGIDRQSLAADLRPVAERLYGLDDGITIIDVAPRSPAAEAGLLPGDVIAGAAKGGVMPSGWTRSGLTIPDLVKVIQASASGSMTLLVRRFGAVFPLNVSPRLGCSYPIELQWDDRFNALSDGNRIVVFSGLFNHVPDERELAVIIGHELAHNVLKHIEKRGVNAAAGMIAGAVLDLGLAALGVNTQGLGMRTGAEAGAKAYSREFESEADYLGLYMLARAGFDVSAGPGLFRRMGMQSPGRQVINYFSTHPSTPERAAAMQQIVEEIRSKASRGEPLLPQTLSGQTLEVAQADRRTAPAAPAKAGALPSAKAGAGETTGDRVTAPAPQPEKAGVGPKSMLAQLLLVEGPIVSNPPQRFNAEFRETGKASVVLFGSRRLMGDFELFGLRQSISEKYKARLINPDAVGLPAGADAKGFAFFSDGAGIEMECAYAVARSTGRGEGMCADNQNNTYRIIFD